MLRWNQWSGGSTLHLVLLITIFAGGFDSSHAANPIQENRSSRFEKLAPFFKPPREWANDFGTYKSPLRFYDGTPVKSAADWTAPPSGNPARNGTT